MKPAQPSVYIFKAENGLVKIGMSQRPNIRVKQVQRAFGLAVDIAHVRAVKDSSKIERAVHALLAEKHRGEEWFDVTVEEAIEALDRVIDPSDAISNQASPDASVKLVKTARAFLGWSQTKLAKQSGLTPGRIKDFESERNTISGNALGKIACAFQRAGLVLFDNGGVGVREKKAAERAAQAAARCEFGLSGEVFPLSVVLFDASRTPRSQLHELVLKRLVVSPDHLRNLGDGADRIGFSYLLKRSQKADGLPEAFFEPLKRLVDIVGVLDMPLDGAVHPCDFLAMRGNVG